MLLSVIVPVYNMAADDKLKWCLDSLVNQTVAGNDYEIIAVDDASTDGSFEIMQQYEAEYGAFFHAIHSPVNHHQGGAKNIGLSVAKGEWIGFIDADDWVTPDYYERLLKKAEETGADMVGCDYSMTPEHGWSIGVIDHNNDPAQTGVLDHEKYRQLVLEPGSLVVTIYKREIIFGDGSSPVFPEDIFYEDNAVANTWMLRAKYFEYIDEPLNFYYQHGNSTVHTLSMKNLEDRKTAGRLMLSEAKKYGYFDTYRDELEFKFTVLFYSNTLFSAMQCRPFLKGCYRFTADLGKEMKETFPDFQANAYYLEKLHPEERKLIAMQRKSQLHFYVYYRALWAYRDLKKMLKGSGK